MRIALFEPDIPPNAAAAARLAACLAVPLAIIEPCGFVWDPRRLRRVSLDYAARADITRHPSWDAFETWRRGVGARLVVLTTQAPEAHHRVAYEANDVLLAGRESAGVPAFVHARADLRVRIPQAPGVRSLNVVSALAIVLGEALRQTQSFPGDVAPAASGGS